MPSHRKRIGFLPSEEVHLIIEKISKDHNYSQSKVTGILVEEALRFSGFLNISISDNSSLIDEFLNNSKKYNNSSFYNELLNNYHAPDMKNKSLKEDIKMIYEYILEIRDLKNNNISILVISNFDSTKFIFYFNIIKR